MQDCSPEAKGDTDPQSDNEVGRQKLEADLQLKSDKDTCKLLIAAQATAATMMAMGEEVKRRHYGCVCVADEICDGCHSMSRGQFAWLWLGCQKRLQYAVMVRPVANQQRQAIPS